MKATKPTIVVISHYANHLLAEALDSIKDQSAPATTIVLHSNDESIDWDKWCLKHSTSSSNGYRWLGKNVGYANAVNWAFTHLSGPLLILNDDVRLETTCLESLIKAHSNYPTALLQPHIYLAQNSSTLENTGHRIHIDGMNSAVGRGQSVISASNTRLCFSGAAIWIPESIYRHPKLSQMDPDLSPFGEDVDYSLRCIRYGFSIRTVAQAKIYHHWGGSYGRYSHQKVAWVESHRIQAKLRSLPWWMLVAAPLSTGIRYLRSSNDDRIPPNQRIGAILATLNGIQHGYLRAPSALRKRAQESFTISDWTFTKQWWKHR